MSKIETKNIREVPLEIIERGLKDSDWRVRSAAMNACSGREVPLEIIERWLKDSDCDVRSAAMNACSGREVPLEIIERGLKDSDCDVRSAAMNACRINGVDIPVIRTIEPPKTVYKKCFHNIIICAEIPDDAQVRGSYGNKCRSSAAKITGIIGDIAGYEVGISLHDRTTMYYVGDEIIIDDFDYSDEECSTGFHFFCTKEEAEEW